MKAGVIYYSDLSIDPQILKICQDRICQAFDGEIISVTLNKMCDFGENIVLDGERGYIMMVKQILTALEASTADYVFFCEHDVLYPDCHFDFVPPRSNIFYYNKNVWRWLYGSDTAIRYERMLPLSCLCADRNLALENYRLRMKSIEEAPEGSFDSKEPARARRWGYEPGTKKKKRGGITDDDFETWESEYPVIDIRHDKTFSPPKIALDSFRHAPVNWQEIPADKIEGWDLKKLFNL